MDVHAEIMALDYLPDPSPLEKNNVVKVPYDEHLRIGQSIGPWKKSNGDPHTSSGILSLIVNSHLRPTSPG
jgi:hypothetical protein